MQLTEHFSLEELTVSETAARLGLDNTPPPAVEAELRATAQLMERVREILRAPILVSSGYRSPDVNRAIGSKPMSAHTRGQAVDFIAPKHGTPLQVCLTLARHADALAFDQLIHEYGRWIHIGRAPTPRKQLLTIDAAGTRLGIS